MKRQAIPLETRFVVQGQVCDRVEMCPSVAHSLSIVSAKPERSFLGFERPFSETQLVFFRSKFLLWLSAIHAMQTGGLR